MKTLQTAICIAMLSVFAASAQSQNRQVENPVLFAGLPSTINLTTAQLSAVFSAVKGGQINLPVATNLALSGVVISNLLKFSNLQTVVIKLPAFKNTLFSISKQTGGHNKATFVGKILNPSFADGYELKPDGNGNYKLSKIATDKILVD
jgi:hypothetical protein